MKIETQKTDVDYIGPNIQQVDYHFARTTEAEKHMMLMARTSLYEDKIGAVVRESLQNSADATLRYAKITGTEPKPIMTFLPTAFGGEVVFRDYGTGMDAETYSKYFMGFWASDKTRDNSETGGFGIGAKSYGAYSEALEVNCYVNGTHWNWLNTFHADGGGDTKLCEVGKTKEHNGVEVRFPLRQEDHRDAFVEALSWYGYWTRVDITCNEELDFPKAVDSIDVGDGFKVHWFKKLSNRRKEESYIVMGGVPYPLNLKKIESQLDDLVERELIKSVFRKNGPTHGYIVLEVPMGFCQPDVSRERIQYDEEGVIARKIAGLCSKAIKALAGGDRGSYLKDCQNSWQAQKKVFTYISLFAETKELMNRFGAKTLCFYKGRNLRYPRVRYGTEYKAYVLQMALNEANGTYKTSSKTEVKDVLFSARHKSKPALYLISDRRSHYAQQIFQNYRAEYLTSANGRNNFTNWINGLAQNVLLVTVPDFSDETRASVQKWIEDAHRAADCEGAPYDAVWLEPLSDQFLQQCGVSIKRIKTGVLRLDDIDTPLTSKSQAYRWTELDWKPKMGDVYTIVHGYRCTTTSAPRSTRTPFPKHVFEALVFLRNECGVEIPDIYGLKPREVEKEDNAFIDQLGDCIELKDWVMAHMHRVVEERGAALTADMHRHPEFQNAVEGYGWYLKIRPEFQLVKAYQAFAPKDGWLNWDAWTRKRHLFLQAANQLALLQGHGHHQGYRKLPFPKTWPETLVNQMQTEMNKAIVADWPYMDFIMDPANEQLACLLDFRDWQRNPTTSARAICNEIARHHERIVREHKRVVALASRYQEIK